MEATRIKINTVIISILIIAAVETVMRLVIDQKFVTPLIGLGAARLAETIALLVLVKIYERRFSAIGLTATDVYKGFEKGLIWAVVFGVIAGGILLIIYLMGFNVSMLFRMQLPAESGNLFVFFLIGVFIGPLAEELFFRGILFGFFRRWGVATAIILSTLFFVLLHPSRNNLPVTQTIGGVLFAVSYEKEKNLLIPITIHSLGNLAIFTLAVFT